MSDQAQSSNIWQHQKWFGWERWCYLYPCVQILKVLTLFMYACMHHRKDSKLTKNLIETTKRGCVSPGCFASGVPQGFCVGPLIYSIILSELLKNKPKNLHLKESSQHNIDISLPFKLIWQTATQKTSSYEATLS